MEHHVGVPMFLAKNTGLPEDVVRTIFSWGDKVSLLELASNSATPMDVLYELSFSKTKDIADDAKKALKKRKTARLLGDGQL
jgi:hypothetical protein